MSAAVSRYIDWLFPGVLGMNMMFTCLMGAGYVVVRYRKNGFLKRLSATPVSAFEFLSAQVMSRLGLALLVTIILYTGIGSVIHFHNAGSVALLLLIAVLGSLSLIAFGLIVAARFASEEVVGGLLNLLTWPMMLLSGIWFSLEGSPRWLQWLAQLFPLTHILQAAHAVTLDGAGIGAVGVDLAYLAGTTLVFLGVGAASFRWRPE
jgi:ABC-type multidrug transport system permease subunit